MIKDPIVEEIRAARRATEEACAGDWAKLIEHYLEIEKRSDHAVLRGAPRRLHRPATPKSEQT